MAEPQAGSVRLDPSHIMRVGLGFWASKTLLAATKLGLFTLLDGGQRTPDEIRASLGLHGRTPSTSWTRSFRSAFSNAPA